MARWSSALRGETTAAAGEHEFAAAAGSSAAPPAEEGEGREDQATVSAGKRKAEDGLDGGGGDKISVDGAAGEDHPYDFRVCGPRNLSSPTWKDIFSSSWKDPNYKRTALACFIQAVYLLELDRQQSNPNQLPAAAAPTPSAALAPQWWRHFHFKVSQVLTDPRDGSIYAAVFEWDRAAALLPLRPAAAPRAVLALRGTLLSAATLRRDLADDLRFLAWESLKGSVRFAGALNAAGAMAELHGGAAVCLAGHSLGAGFALQVGKALAKKGIFLECHLFNPPAVSVAAGVKSLSDKALAAWHRLRSGGAAGAGEDDQTPPSPGAKWAPHLYVNNSDYLCCYYCTDKPPSGAAGSPAAAKLFVAAAKTPQRFVEAHGLQQWWSEDVELRHVPGHRSELIHRQLKSLYS